MAMFSIMGILFPIMFFLVFGIIAYTIVQGIRQWDKNNKSPRLTVFATVVAKRTNVSHHHNHMGDNSAIHHSTSTTYYVTFQVDSGDRMELQVSGQEYGLIVEGDRGMLSFQGTRFLNFERE